MAGPQAISRVKVCIVGLALLLGACVTAKPAPEQSTVDATPVPSRPLAAVPDSAVAAKPEQTPALPAKVAVAKPAAKPVTPVAPAANPPPPPEPAVNLEQLVGLQNNDVAALFGAPGLQRREPPGEIWQYRNRDCVLHVFLYEAPPSGQRVEHVEISSPEEMAGGSCLKSLLRAQAGIPALTRPRYASSLAP